MHTAMDRDAANNRKRCVLQPYSVTGVEYKRRDLKWTKQQKPFSFQFEAIRNSCTITKAHILHLWKWLLARTRNTPTIAHSAGAVVVVAAVAATAAAFRWLAVDGSWVCRHITWNNHTHCIYTGARSQHAPTHIYGWCSGRVEHLFYVKKRRRPFFEAHKECVLFRFDRLFNHRESFWLSLCVCASLYVRCTVYGVWCTRMCYRPLPFASTLVVAIYTHSLFLCEHVFSTVFLRTCCVCLVGRISSKTHRQGDGWHLFRYFRWRECWISLW